VAASMGEAILVTGGAGFIGSNFILQWIANEGTPVINLDKLTYAGNLRNLEHISAEPRYKFVYGDIIDRDLVCSLFERYRPRALVHFAAESHVDRSIRGPDDFVRTNVQGCRNASRPPSDSCTSLQTRSTDLSGLMMRPSAKPTRTRRIARTPPPKLVLITWCVPITTHIACRLSLQIVRTTTDRTSFQKNLSL